MLTAKPRLLEPVYLVEIACPQDACGGIYSCLTPRRGHVFEENPVVGTTMIQCKAYLPVMESFGFTADLRSKTQGQAFPQCVFDHWQMQASDPLTEGTQANGIVTAARARKGLSPQPKGIDNYYDKL